MNIYDKMKERLEEKGWVQGFLYRCGSMCLIGAAADILLEKNWIQFKFILEDLKLFQIFDLQHTTNNAI